MQENDGFSALFLKRWREQRPKDFDLKTPEGQLAEFGDVVMAFLSDHWTDDEVDPMATLTRMIYVSGDWLCPTCHYRQHQRILYAQTGDVGINHEAPDACPNDGTPMRRLTWREDATAANQIALDLMKEIRRLRERIDELEPRH